MKHIIRLCDNCGKNFRKPFRGKGKYINKYCSKKCSNIRQSVCGSASGNGNWKGGKIINRGYYFIFSPNHPLANGTGYVREHRLVMEKHLGRYLKPEERVHHINENKLDNRISNLQIVSASEHTRIHYFNPRSPLGNRWHSLATQRP